MGALMYADYLVLVSGSIADLQSMIDICVSELCCLDMKINSKKSSCIRFGKNCNYKSVHINYVLMECYFHGHHI